MRLIYFVVFLLPEILIKNDSKQCLSLCWSHMLSWYIDTKRWGPEGGTGARRLHLNIGCVMHCIVSSGGTTAPERGKRNPKRLAGASANGRPESGCSCAAADQWRGGRSQQGWAPTRRVVVVSEQQKPEGLLTHRITHIHRHSHTAVREGKDFGRKVWTLRALRSHQAVFFLCVFFINEFQRR